MNIALERAREACAACRKSHKRCTLSEDSVRCLRCKKRNTDCSFSSPVSDETAPVVQPGLPALAPTESASDAQWEVTPGSAVSLSFVPSETIPAAQPGLPALAPTEPAPDAQWEVTPGESTLSPSFSYHYVPPLPHERYYPPNATIITGTAQFEVEYPTNPGVTFQPPANPNESAQPAMNQDGLYDPLNRVFQ